MENPGSPSPLRWILAVLLLLVLAFLAGRWWGLQSGTSPAGGVPTAEARGGAVG